MPNKYDAVKSVRKRNGQQFIEDFHSCRDFLCMTASGGWFAIKKSDVWDTAKIEVINYSIDFCPYVVKRRCFTVL